MALSRREWMLAGFPVLISWCILNYWLPSLRLLPLAFLWGIISTFCAFVFVFSLSVQSSHNDTVRPALDTTYLSFTSASTWQKESRIVSRSFLDTDVPSLEPLTGKVAGIVDGLLKLVVRDFVRNWYIRLSPGNAFPLQLERAVRIALKRTCEKVETLDVVVAGVTRLLPQLSQHINQFVEAERQVRGKDLSQTSSKDADDTIATKYGDGKLHSACGSAAAQQNHLRNIVTMVVQEVLPENLLTSGSVIVMIREIVACAILHPLLQMLGDPDMVNQMIESYGRAVLREKKTVRKLRAALDEHAPTTIRPNSKFPKLSPNDSERSFERFIRGIRTCETFADAQVFRADVQQQLRRDSKTMPYELTYLRRLEIGLKLLDQRVSQLAVTPIAYQESGEGKGQNPTLREVLYDTSGLSYFMEFMDNLQMMKCVQFWIVVDGLRVSLDTPVKQKPSAQQATKASQKELLMQVKNAYLWRPELNVPKEVQDAVQKFVEEGSTASDATQARACQALLRAQDLVYNEMVQEYLPAFRDSKLYKSWISPEQQTQKTPSLARPQLRERSSMDESALNPAKKAVGDGPAVLKPPDLRRAIASSSDLAVQARRASELNAQPRRSLDDSRGRKPLFDDDLGDDPMSRSTQSLRSDQDANSEKNASKMAAEAVQATLDDIVDRQSDAGSQASEHNRASTPQQSLQPSPLGIDREDEFVDLRPSITSLGLVGETAPSRVFTHDDLFGESENLWEEQSNGSGNEEDDNDEDIQEAAPGDLGLAEVVQGLTLDIDKLEAQLSIVQSLYSKAELTGNAAELRILRKSKTGLEKDIHHKELQRQQYIVQESDNSLYGKALVSIKSIMVGTESDGHEYAIYVIEVKRQGNEKAESATWTVARRYSEFHELHRRLRARFPSVKTMEFPKRKVVLTLQQDFLKRRKIALEKYLRELLTRPAICRSLELRAFLSQQSIRPLSISGEAGVDRQDLVSRIYSSVNDGMEEFLGNVPMLDQISAAGQNLITSATMGAFSPIKASSAEIGADQLGNSPTFSPVGNVGGDAESAAEAQAEQNAFEEIPQNANVAAQARMRRAAGESAPEVNPATPKDQPRTFVQPIADGFVALFQLQSVSGAPWLRGRAIVVVLQQILGGTVERRVRDVFRTLTSESQLSEYLLLLKETIWPNGALRESPPERTLAAKTKSKAEAEIVLSALLIDAAGGVVGRQTAQEAGSRINRMLGNEKLNRHLMLTLLDHVVEVVFDVRVN